MARSATRLAGLFSLALSCTDSVSPDFTLLGTRDDCLASDATHCFVIGSLPASGQSDQYRVVDVEEDEESVRVRIEPPTAESNDAEIHTEVPIDAPLGDRDVFVNGSSKPLDE